MRADKKRSGSVNILLTFDVCQQRGGKDVDAESIINPVE